MRLPSARTVQRRWFVIEDVRNRFSFTSVSFCRDCCYLMEPIQEAYGGRVMFCRLVVPCSEGASVRSVVTAVPVTFACFASSETVCGCAVKFIATITAG